MLESIASEHSARMVAMRNATDNAKDLVTRPDAVLQQGAPGADHERGLRDRGRRERAGG